MHPPVRLVAIDMDGTLLPTFAQALTARTARALRAAQQAGIIVALATGRRQAFAAPLLLGHNLRADMPLITSNGAVTRTLSGHSIDRCHLPARTARALCGLLRPYGTLVFTFDRDGHGDGKQDREPGHEANLDLGRDLLLENLDDAHQRMTAWVESNRHAIRTVPRLEDALPDTEDGGDDPIQGMVCGSVARMKEADQALRTSALAADCDTARTEYPARDLSILDLMPPGVSKGWALGRLAGSLGIDRLETMAIGDNWNDVEMLEWAGQGVVMGNAAAELRTMAKLRGWKQAPPNDEDGVAVVLERELARQGVPALP
jgi:HAD superfamily hydrolase (TIGR01484 family)